MHGLHRPLLRIAHTQLLPTFIFMWFGAHFGNIYLRRDKLGSTSLSSGSVRSFWTQEVGETASKFFLAWDMNFVLFAVRKRGFNSILSISLTQCFTTIYWSLNYTTSAMKNILMVYIFQNICPLASRKSTYLNKMWGRSNNEPHVKKYLVFHHHVTQK